MPDYDGRKAPKLISPYPKKPWDGPSCSLNLLAFLGIVRDACKLNCLPKLSQAIQRFSVPSQTNKYYHRTTQFTLQLNSHLNLSFFIQFHYAVVDD